MMANRRPYENKYGYSQDDKGNNDNQERYYSRNRDRTNSFGRDRDYGQSTYSGYSFNRDSDKISTQGREYYSNDCFGLKPKTMSSCRPTLLLGNTVDDQMSLNNNDSIQKSRFNDDIFSQRNEKGEDPFWNRKQIERGIFDNKGSVSGLNTCKDFRGESNFEKNVNYNDQKHHTEFSLQSQYAPDRFSQQSEKGHNNESSWSNFGRKDNFNDQQTRSEFPQKSQYAHDRFSQQSEQGYNNKSSWSNFGRKDDFNDLKTRSEFSQKSQNAPDRFSQQIEQGHDNKSSWSTFGRKDDFNDQKTCSEFSQQSQYAPDRFSQQSEQGQDNNSSWSNFGRKDDFNDQKTRSEFSQQSQYAPDRFSQQSEQGQDNNSSYSNFGRKDEFNDQKTRSEFLQESQYAPDRFSQQSEQGQDNNSSWSNFGRKDNFNDQQTRSEFSQPSQYAPDRFSQQSEQGIHNKSSWSDFGRKDNFNDQQTRSEFSQQSQYAHDRFSQQSEQGQDNNSSWSNFGRKGDFNDQQTHSEFSQQSQYAPDRFSQQSEQGQNNKSSWSNFGRKDNFDDQQTHSEFSQQSQYTHDRFFQQSEKGQYNKSYWSNFGRKCDFNDRRHPSELLQQSQYKHDRFSQQSDKRQDNKSSWSNLKMNEDNEFSQQSECVSNRFTQENEQQRHGIKRSRSNSAHTSGFQQARREKNFNKEGNHNQQTCPSNDELYDNKFNTEEDCEDDENYSSEGEEITNSPTIKPDPELVEKYKYFPPSAEEMGNIFEGLVIYFFHKVKDVKEKNPFVVICESFRRSNRFGDISVEDGYQRGNPTIKFCTLRWYGMMLVRGIGYTGNLKEPRVWAGVDLINKLAQTCYTLQMKCTYFTKPAVKKFLDGTAHSDFIRILKPNEALNIESARALIVDFFEDDNDCELFFVDKKYTFELKFWAKNQGYDCRTPQNMDVLGVSIKRTPQYWVDKLLAGGQTENDKYILYPPQGRKNLLDGFDITSVIAQMRNKRHLKIDKTAPGVEKTKYAENDEGLNIVQAIPPWRKGTKGASNNRNLRKMRAVERAISDGKPMPANMKLKKKFLNKLKNKYGKDVQVKRQYFH